VKVHFVGGFLGSGKTTAIAGACRILISRGLRVGVVTNDQGKLQVDGLFMRAAGIPAVEVGGGCFCCRYDDFDASVAALAERERPDLIFAESVGSCADLVATVLRPFESFREAYGAGSLLSVFADSRLLLARLSGRRLPFSEDVLYVFDRQLAEADLLVLNKVDLLDASERASLRALASAEWPGKATIEVSGATEEGAAAWLEALSSGSASSREDLLIDYPRYGSGEAELAWLDERLVLEDGGGLASNGGECRKALRAFVLALGGFMAEESLAVGHVKLQVSALGTEFKLSLTSGDFLSGPGLETLIDRQLPSFLARRLMVSLNARVQCAPERLAAMASKAAEAARAASRASLREEDRSAFSPGEPRPTHRMAGFSASF
jgi:Ni2+-binding GTPase involved in maturation of urease and hydrogenase